MPKAEIANPSRLCVLHDFAHQAEQPVVHIRADLVRRCYRLQAAGINQIESEPVTASLEASRVGSCAAHLAKL